MSVSFTTTAAVKDYMGVDHSDWDTLIASLIQGMSAFIESYTGRTFTSQEFTEQYDGRDGNGGVLRLKHFPVSAVASLYDDTSREYGSDTLKDRSAYVLYEEQGVVRLVDGYEFSISEQNIQITYTAGYDSVPDDIAQACVELVATKLSTRSQGAAAGTVQSERLGRWQVSYFEGKKVVMSESVASTLDRYKGGDVFLI